jgi:hypothetical protein
MVGWRIAGLVRGGGCALALAIALAVSSCGGSDETRAKAGSGGVPADSAAEAQGGSASGTGGSASGTGGNSGNGGGGTAGSPDSGDATDAERATCRVWCEEQADTGCPDTTPKAECPARCAALPRDPECGAEYIATTACVARGDLLVCAGNRLGIEANDCFSEIQPYLVCAACRPTPNDDTCDTCEKANCCAEFKAFVGHPDFTAVSECSRACQEQDGGLDCLSACLARFPDYSQTVSAMTACRERCWTTCR